VLKTPKKLLRLSKFMLRSILDLAAPLRLSCAVIPSSHRAVPFSRSV
jgi:hypothetical protein